MAKGENIYFRHNERKKRAKSKRWFNMLMSESDTWWKMYEVSNRRKYAKKFTAKRNRSKARQICESVNTEEPKDKPSTYRKRHEYQWEIL